MKIITTIIFVLLIFTATSCGNAEAPTAFTSTETPSLMEDVIVTNTDFPEPTAITPTISSKILPISECTVVSTLPGPENNKTGAFAVMEDDWAIGPDDADLTLIEYGDFQ